MGLGVPLEDVQKQATTEYWWVMFIIPGLIGFV